MAKVEMTYLNSSGTYETIYPKVDLSNITGTLPVANGGTGTTSLDSLMTNMGAARIQTGSYVGTGTYGASNPCSLTFDFDFTYFWILTDNYRFYGLHEFSDGITKSYFLNVSLVTNNYPSYDSNSHDNPAYFRTWGSKYCTRVKYSNKVLNWFIVYTGSNSNEYTASSQFNRSNIVYSYIAF